MPFESSLAKKLVHSTVLNRSNAGPISNAPAAHPSPPASSQSSVSSNRSDVERPVLTSTHAQTLPITRTSARQSEASTNQQFGIWVQRLESRVNALQSQVRSEEPETVLREENTCRAELHHLNSYASQHAVDTSPYRDRLERIRCMLDAIRAHAQSREQLAEQHKRPLWQKVLKFVLDVASFIETMLGLPPMFRTGSALLRAARDQKLLS